MNKAPKLNIDIELDKSLIQMQKEIMASNEYLKLLKNNIQLNNKINDPEFVVMFERYIKEREICSSCIDVNICPLNFSIYEYKNNDDFEVVNCEKINKIIKYYNNLIYQNVDDTLKAIDLYQYDSKPKSAYFIKILGAKKVPISTYKYVAEKDGLIPALIDIISKYYRKNTISVIDFDKLMSNYKASFEDKTTYFDEKLFENIAKSNILIILLDSSIYISNFIAKQLLNILENREEKQTILINNIHYNEFVNRIKNIRQFDDTVSKLLKILLNYKGGGDS